MIDWAFISTLEGHRISGYVPDAEGSNSGVTIADGVDLGQMTQETFAVLPPDVQALVEPYVGLRKQDAVEKLKRWPLSVSEAQAQAINMAVRAPLVRALQTHYDKDTSGTLFEHVPDACQTVLCSVTFQYGTPWQRCPVFWGHAVNQDWPGVLHVLENFGDAYPTRREKEAAYLKAKLGA